MSWETQPDGRDFSYRDSRLRDGTDVLLLGGELDVLSSSLELEELLRRGVEERCHILVDMSRVSFVDAWGLDLLIRTMNALKACGRRLVIISPQSQVQRLLALTGLDTRVAIVDSRSGAEVLLDGGRDRAGVAACQPLPIAPGNVGEVVPSTWISALTSPSRGNRGPKFEGVP